MKNISLIAGLSALIFTSHVSAQSVFTVGGTGVARDCYLAALTATQTGLASQQDLEPCDYAISHVRLGLRDRAATYINRGVIYSASEMYNEALADYEKALGLDAEIGVGYLNKGNIMFVLRRFDAAIEQYNMALQRETSKPHIVFLNRGMAYENSGDTQLAYGDYTSALELRPEWTKAEKRMRRLLARNPRVELPAGYTAPAEPAG